MKPQVCKRTISAIQCIITGNEGVEQKPLSPYRSGPKLVDFFNGYGFNDTYSNGFPSRWAYAEERLELINGTEKLKTVIEASVAPDWFLETGFSVSSAIEYLNRFLEFDGYKLTIHAKRPVLTLAIEQAVVVETVFSPAVRMSHEFIAEQLAKCDKKLNEHDYDGAITNARSLVEAVLRDLEELLSAEPPPAYDGEMMKLFKRVQKLLNLEPDRADLDENFKQVLRGLTGVVAGLAPLRNKMGDAHVRSFKPSRHHAKFVVNAAKTGVEFLYDTYVYQTEKGLLNIPA